MHVNVPACVVLALLVVATVTITTARESRGKSDRHRTERGSSTLMYWTVIALLVGPIACIFNSIFYCCCGLGFKRAVFLFVMNAIALSILVRAQPDSA